VLEHIKIEDVLFLDIETVPQHPDFSHLDETMQKLWEHKATPMCKDGQTPEILYERAGIYAEFGKIVCISLGFAYRLNDSKQLAFRIKSCFDDDEKKLLTAFSETIKRFAMQRANMLLCAHNGKEFDFPYIARRMLLNGLVVPTSLETAGKKPWETSFIDTMELWRFGDYKNYTSLKLLTHIFNIPSPKDDIDGSKVAEVYWKEKNLPRIARYCEKDVLAIAQLMLRYKGMELIDDENVNASV